MKSDYDISQEEHKIIRKFSGRNNECVLMELQNNTLNSLHFL